MMVQTAKGHLQMVCKNVSDLRPVLACRGLGSCLERYIEQIEKAGQKFFEDEKPSKIFCNAQTCRRNKRGCCAVDFNNDNPHSLDESGRCLDYTPV